MTDNRSELQTVHLRRVCDPASLGFHSTAELPPLDEVIGQERAVRAVSFGIDIQSTGYHVFALGPAGTGKATTIRQFLERKAAAQPVPDDWCYGDQGVVIPHSNVKHLMLHQDVIDAVAQGKFHVYAISTVEEAIALLTGRDAGQRRPDGSYPQGTVFAAVDARLHALAERVKEFAKPQTASSSNGAGEPAEPVSI